jgi:rubrerythrin
MMNVFDFAMRMEEEHCGYYEKLAAAARSKELKTIFTLLADSEREHHEHLTFLKAGTDPKLAWSVALERAKKHISKLVEDLPPEEVLQSDYDGYRHAIRQEEMSINLYEKLADQEPNKTVAEVMRRIAEEERHHLEVMENIYDFVESPRTYLAWGEFSNLREY